MEHQKILNLLNEANDSKFVTRSMNSNTNYGVGSEIIYNTEVKKSNISDYNDAYILVRGNITNIGHQVIQAAFKNCALFTKYITNIDEKTIDDTDYLD